MKRDYSVAIGVLTLCSWVGWLVVGGGVIYIGAAIAKSALTSGLLLGLPAMLAGLIQVALAQMGLAHVSTAQLAAEILDELRRRAPVDEEAASPARSAPPRSEGYVKTYKGHDIRRRDGEILVGNKVFAGLAEAERFIDSGK